MELKRLLSLPVGKNSFFLFGPRQTGKTTLVQKSIAEHESMQINLLHNETFLKYKKNPVIFRNEVKFFMEQNRGKTVFVDEIQKLPEILDEIHSLLEEYKKRISFIMTGSSARKLRRVSATNLLGGRAWSFSLFPFTHVEMGEHFSLSHVLQYGSLPPILGMSKTDTIKTLNAYTGVYLKEEIIDEALVRNLSAFNRFLDLAADSSGEIVNYSTFARETGVASRTIKEYYQILEDTLIAFKLEPYLKSARKRLIVHPKYYLFDTGVFNSICGRLNSPLVQGTSLYGRCFEHFIILELNRLIHYLEKPWRIYFWRTSHGAEADIVMVLPEKLYGIEIKSAEYVSSMELTGLKQFLKNYPQAKGVCVCNAERPYKEEGISFLPWRYFFVRELGLSAGD